MAEKRRLLEKARMKGRKGKKASKKAQNNAANAQHSQNPPPGGYDRHADDVSLEQDEEYYDDDGYDDVPSTPGTQCQYGCQHHPHPAHPPPQKTPGIPPGDSRMGGPPIANAA